MSATNTHTHTQRTWGSLGRSMEEKMQKQQQHGGGGHRGLGVLQMEADTETGNCETAWAIALWLFS